MSRLTHEEINQISRQICNYPDRPLPEDVRFLVSSMLDLVSQAYADAKKQKAEPPEPEAVEEDTTVTLFDEAARRAKPAADGDDALEQAAAMVETAIGRWALSGPFRFSDVIDVNEVRDLLKDVARDIRGLKQGEDLPEMFPNIEQIR